MGTLRGSVHKNNLIVTHLKAWDHIEEVVHFIIGDPVHASMPTYEGGQISLGFYSQIQGLYGSLQ